MPYKSTEANHYRGTMGQDGIGTRLQLTGEEKDRLFIGLLREWWIMAVQGLTEVAGIDVALKILKPYCQNMGESGYQKLIGATGLKADDAPDLAVFSLGVLHVACSGGKVRIWSDEPDLAVAEITECFFKGDTKVPWSKQLIFQACDGRRITISKDFYVI